MPSLSDQLRAAIKSSGRTQYELAKTSGVRQPTISRFLGGATMELDTAGKLATALKLRLAKQQ